MCVCVRERIEIFINNNYLLLRMVDEKPLAKKKDLYSLRRLAMMDIIAALNEGKSKERIYLHVTMRYGFGEKMVDRMIELVMIEEDAKK